MNNPQEMNNVSGVKIIKENGDLSLLPSVQKEIWNPSLICNVYNALL